MTTAVGTPSSPTSPVLEIYPQPGVADAPLYLSWNVPGASTATLQVFDLLGRELYRQTLQASGLGLTTSALRLPGGRPGVFILPLGDTARLFTIISAE